MKPSAATHQPAGPLEIRGTLATRYGDVYTPAALAALEVLAPFDRDRQALMQARMARRAARAAAREPIGFLDPDALIGRTAIRVRDARSGQFDGGTLPPDLDRQWIQGTGPAARPDAPLERSLRNVAYALLSGADGWMFDGEDALGAGLHDVARQPAQSRTCARARPGVPRRGGAGGRRDEHLVGRLLQPADRGQLAAAARRDAAHLPGARPAPRRPPRALGRRPWLLGLDRRPRALRGQLPPPPRGARPSRGALPAEDPDGRRSRALARPPDGARAVPGHRPGLDQGLRARGAARGVLSAHGDSRGARPALRRLQHRPLGLHQQRVRCRGLGCHVPEPEHRRHHHDLRLHARLRRPGAARREHARPERPVRALAGRHGAEHPRRFSRRRVGQHGARRGRRRTRARRGRQRQVGGALEDGAHRATGLGSRRVGQSARTHLPRPHLHRRRRGPAARARGGAAHGARRARSASAWPSSMATPSARGCRRRRSSRPTSSATTTCST